jgi:hypothetical protein
MTNSFIITMLLPLTTYMLASNLATLLRFFIYKLTLEEQQSKPAIGVDEQPVLVLECDGNSQVLPLVVAMFLVLLSLSIFLFVDGKMDMQRAFFFLTSEQTYILYYLVWKFQSLVCLFCFCAVSIQSLTRKVIFYKNAVVVENSIMGRGELPLDDNVKRNDAGSKGRGWWIYDERKGINLKVYSKTFMELTHEQEKLLTEIMSRIPEKKKRFMLI